ncbi:MAG TPA: hypothetical protein PKJ14_00410 [Candidatus Cloacimonadota bacterium]|nr:hypothetical protein [Candidatus Cloacimonadota bacterium]HQL14249.1 hypothetical protein [Candidatus Cloacimonadota bacterium]
MARISLVFIILLLAISYGYADGLPSEEAERQAKEHQLGQVADRFKAETGFRGEIKFNDITMGIGKLEGNFTDIPFSADEDTTSFRQACNRIIDKLLPYTLATRSQLSMSRISNNLGRTETEYCQTVNGYRVENGGLILIAYDAGRYRFSISNGTVELPSQTITPILTYEDAVIIYDDNVKDDETIKNIRERRPFLGLRFCNIYNEWEGDTRTEYRLCWTGGYTRTIYVDAQTGQVYKIVDMTMDDK